MLRTKFPDLRCSRVYESEAVGFVGDNFLNLVACVETGLSLAEVSLTLKALEDELGRDRDQPRFSGRTMDIDILTFGDLQGEFDGIVLPRDEILQHAFVLQPLADLLPQQKYPVSGIPYAQLWSEFAKPDQTLWPIEFDWQ